jgi:hypothetical protein
LSVETAGIIPRIVADFPCTNMEHHVKMRIVENTRLQELLDYAFSVTHPVNLLIGLKDLDDNVLGAIVISVNRRDGGLVELLYEFFDFPQPVQRHSRSHAGLGLRHCASRPFRMSLHSMSDNLCHL